MQQTSRKAEPGDYKHAVNGIKLSNIIEVANAFTSLSLHCHY